MDKKSKKKLFVCPECECEDILVYSMTSWEINKDMEYFCESVKPYDSDAPARCIDCHWDGISSQLTVEE